MIRLVIVGDLTATLDSEFKWSCEDKGFEELLNNETEELMETMSPAHGNPRLYVVSRMAEIVKADRVETDEDKVEARDAIY